MKILTWNVNGLRANVKKGGFDWLLSQDFEIICLQETKVNSEQLEDNIRNPEGYISYFDHSKVKKGYSGVAIYVDKTRVFEKFGNIEKVEYGLGLKELDQEGRLIGLHFKDFAIFNIYFPNGGGGPERLDYKLRFYDAFFNHIEKIRKGGKNIIFCGDVNTAHKPIDLARPKENEKNTGFLPIERAWIDKLISHKYVDVFRKIYSEDIKYTWWDMKTFARERNVGWRIDYFFVNEEFFGKIKDIKILDDVLGSDHCPVVLNIGL